MSVLMQKTEDQQAGGAATSVTSQPNKPSACPRGTKARSIFVQLALALAVSAWAVFSWIPGRSTPWSRTMASAADDALTHAEYGAGAADALAEGQWPIRELPRVNGPVGRDAIFQFYAVAPYVVAGALGLTGLDPWRALVIAVCLSFAVGYLGAWVLCRELGVGSTSATLGAVVFSWSPYHLTDWFGRAAWPELFALGVLPWVFWSSWRLALRLDAGRLAIAGIVWFVLILSHNIFHIWTIPFIGVLCAWEGWIARRPGIVPWRVVPGYLLGLGMGMFFFAGPLVLGSSLQVSGTADPFFAAVFSPLRILFAPFWAQVPEAASAPNLGLQIGWPILLGAAGFIVSRRREALHSGFLALFALSIFLAWSPVDIWRFLGPFKIIQFPYRLLTYASVFGGVLVAAAFDRMRWRPLIALAIMLAIHAAWALDWKSAMADVSSERLESHYREVGATPRNGLCYRIADSVLANRFADHDLTRGRAGVLGEGPGNTRWLAPAGSAPVFGSASFGPRGEIHARSAGNSVLVIDRLWYPDIWDVRVNDRPVQYGFAGSYLAVELPPGESIVEWRFVGWWWANVISLAAIVTTACLLLWSIPAVRRALGRGDRGLIAG